MYRRQTGNILTSNRVQASSLVSGADLRGVRQPASRPPVILSWEPFLDSFRCELCAVAGGAGVDGPEHFSIESRSESPVSV